MTEPTRTWWRRNAFTLLALGLAVSALLTLSGILYTAKVSSQQVEDRAVSRSTAESAEATQLALCKLIAVYLPRPGDSPPTTERGRVVIARFREAFRELVCDPVLLTEPVTPAPTVRPVPTPS